MARRSLSAPDLWGKSAKPLYKIFIPPPDGWWDKYLHIKTKFLYVLTGS